MRERRRRLEGHVVSDRMDKTVVVRIERRVRHASYGKVVMRSKKVKAHDEANACRIGDVVRLLESRPLSREKRWVVDEILKRAPVGIGTEDGR